MCGENRKRHSETGGCVFSIFQVVLVAFALAMPWYFMRTQYKLTGDGCDQLTLQGWFDIYCTAQNCINNPCQDAMHPWRNNGNQNLQNLYNSCLALMLGAGVAAVLIMILFIAAKLGARENCCVRMFVIAAGIAGAALVAASVVLFAVRYPGALQDDNGGAAACSLQFVNCNSFFAIQQDTATATLSWGGAGWILAGITFPGFVVLAILGFNVGAY